MNENDRATTPKTAFTHEEGSSADLVQRVSASGPRHFSTTSVIRFFAWNHLRPDLAEVSRLFAGLAVDLVGRLSDGPELTVALRKLLEGKDAAVRQALTDKGLI